MAVEKTAGDDTSLSRLPLDEESELIEESSRLRTTANDLFTTSKYTEAIDGYNRAYEQLPTYLDYDLAVLKSNIAACHLKLSEWKEAIEAATAALEKLNLVDPLPEAPKQGERKSGADTTAGHDAAATAAAIVEIDDATASRQDILTTVSGKSLTDTSKLRTKTLLRRAKARSSEGGWSNLQGALEDYQTLSSLGGLTSLDRRAVDMALRDIPPRLEVAKNEEMADMMGKLKGLGNGILKPFGLSTDNFQFVKDENTGGYSMNFKQNPAA